MRSCEVVFALGRAAAHHSNMTIPRSQRENYRNEIQDARARPRDWSSSQIAALHAFEIAVQSDNLLAAETAREVWAKVTAVLPRSR